MRARTDQFYNIKRINHSFCRKDTKYKGSSFDCGTVVLHDVLSIFHSFQPVDVFSLDRNSVSCLKFQALNAEKGHTQQTLKNDTARSSLGLISTYGEFVFQ